MPLADAFVSDRDSVLQMSDETQPSLHLGGTDVKGIDIVKLGQLRSIISGKSFNEVLPEFPEVHSISEDDGPWVFEVSQRLVEALAKLDAIQLQQLACQWSKIEEFELDGMDESTVESILRDLVQLSKAARAEGKSVFLWNCL